MSTLCAASRGCGQLIADAGSRGCDRVRESSGDPGPDRVRACGDELVHVRLHASKRLLIAMAHDDRVVGRAGTEVRPVDRFRHAP